MSSREIETPTTELVDLRLAWANFGAYDEFNPTIGPVGSMTEKVNIAGGVSPTATGVRPMFQRLCLTVIGLIVSLLLASASRAQERETLRRQFLGKAPPDLVCQPEHWLGKSEPVTIAGLKGRVIWLQFNF